MQTNKPILFYEEAKTDKKPIVWKSAFTLVYTGREGRAGSQEFATGRAISEAENNIDLNPAYRSSLRSSRFFYPNLGDLQKKKKKFFSQAGNPVFLVEITLCPSPILIANANGGAIFVFSAKIGLKSAKKSVVFCILFRPNGGERL